jgi:hypothetical protein
VFLASILSLTCGNGPVRRVGFWLREPDRANAEQTRLQSRPSFSLSCQLLVSTLLWCGGCPWLSGPDLLIQGRTHIGEPTTGDLNPFRTVRGQGVTCAALSVSAMSWAARPVAAQARSAGQHDRAQNFGEIAELLRVGTTLVPTDFEYGNVVQSGLGKKAPFSSGKNSVADAMLIELYATQLRQSGPHDV